jgi:S-DNA-T family DNA segregation ATPase FtsK/SpoIIIE
LFYKNIPQHESAYDLTEQLASTETPAIKQKAPVQAADSNIVEANDTAQNAQHSIAAKTASTDNAHHQLLAEKLFADVVAKEQQSVQSQEVLSTEDFEQTLKQAHQLEADSQRLIQTGEVWRALQHDDASHKQEIDALLRAADDAINPSSQYVHAATEVSSVAQRPHQSPVDWNDDQIFDELLAAVPNSKTATDVHKPFIQETRSTAKIESDEIDFDIELDSTEVQSVPQATAVQSHHTIKNMISDDKQSILDEGFDEFEDLLIEDKQQQSVLQTPSYAQSSAFVKAPIEIETPKEFIKRSIY